MQIDQLLDKVPLWVIFIITCFITILSLKIGNIAGRHRRKKLGDEKEGPVGSVVGAMLGLLAFIMAFTFGMTAERFQTRKSLLLDEVNAIATAYLRTDILTEPERSVVKELMREYVDIRANISTDPIELKKAIERSEEIQKKIWAHVMSFAETHRDSDTTALIVESMNEVFDLHTSRVTVGLSYRIPWVIWLMLYLISIITMVSVGFQFGLSGVDDIQINILLTICFSLVILLIADLDTRTKGLLKVSQKPMVELQQKLHKSTQ